jgi:hypothetical protein
MTDSKKQAVPYGSRRSPGRHYLQSCVRPDVWAAIQSLTERHGLSISGAAHHLMRLGAGLQPLFPFENSDD